MDNQIPWTTLGRYLSGECTLEEEREVESWIKEDPERKKLINELKEVLEDPRKGEKWDVDSAWKTISEKLESKRQSQLRLVSFSEDEIPRISRSRFYSRKRTFGSYVAASMLLLAITLVSAFYYYQTRDRGSEAPLVMQEVVAEMGQRSQFRLNDGTQVWLNADSRLKIPSNFTSGTRSVHLEGEAFFKVTPEADRPFIIKTAKSITKVLGTQFNVRAYSDEEEVQVVVEEGRVAFGRSGDTIEGAPELTDKQMGILTEKKQTVIRDVGNLDQYVGWTRGKLIFRDTPMAKVVRRLERWYDIECIITDPVLAERTVTASFEDESLTEVLKIISLSVGMVYEREKRSVMFSS